MVQGISTYRTIDLTANAVNNSNANVQSAETNTNLLTANAAADSVTLSSNASNAAASSKSSAVLKSELDNLERQKSVNYTNIGRYEQKIEDLIQQIEKKIDEAAAKEDEATKSYTEECKQVARQEIQEYVNANKNGKGMTQDEFAQNLKTKMPNAPALTNAVMALTQASSFSGQINSLTTELKTLIQNTQNVENQLVAVQAQYDAALKAEEAARQAQAAASSASGSGTDPIGFKYNDETYDFIVDDGEFNSTSDFLGAETQWNAMQALDADGNGSVDTNELKKSNIKVVDSKGKSHDISETFGNDFSVDLTSYDKNGQYSGLDSANQQLLGTFTVKVKDEAIKGYNTLDNTDWLSNKFGLTNSQSVTQKTATATAENSLLSSLLQGHMDKAEGYQSTIEQKNSDIQQGYKDLGLTQQEINQLDEIITVDSVSSTQNFFATLSKQNQEEEEKQKQKLAA